MVISKTDSYKVSHYKQFPKDMTGSFYYIESRSISETLRFFGLQAILKKYFFDTPTMKEVAKWGKFWEAHGLPFNYAGWEYIAKLGYYPVTIKAVPEGSLVSSGVPMITVECTDSHVPWLAGWIETILLQVWYPTTVCTKSYNCKQVIKEYLEDTGGIEGLDFKLHDFGYRGVSSQESAGIGGAAHLVNFMGTDTVEGIIDLMEYYNVEDMPAFSIPASEHSTITSWGKDKEVDAYENMLDQFATDRALVACVSDSYDLTNAVLNIWGGELKDKVVDSGATLVIRPDSGDPADVLVRTIREINMKFGSTTNSNGYGVLPDCIKVIQGDGISSPDDIDYILGRVKEAGWSASNVTFGMGGGLLQDLNRDTYKFAMKMSAIRRNDTWFNVFKSPKDAPWKASKKGRMTLDANGNMVTLPYDGVEGLNIVFKDGELLVNDSLDTIRGRA